MQENKTTWYFSKKKIEEMSPSRKDDITVQHEEKLELVGFI